LMSIIGERPVFGMLSRKRRLNKIK